MEDTEHSQDARQEDQRDIGRRVRIARETLGLTQEEAAAALGMKRTSVTQMELGKRSITATELVHLGKLYRRSVEWLLGQEDDSVTSAAALFRATRELSDHDKEQVLRFARFLGSAGPAPDGKAQ
ncbi:helix-turn-helix domain-containing protein [Arthrobacter sp. Z4-13]